MDWFCRFARDQLSHSCDHHEFWQSVNLCCRLEQAPIIRRFRSERIEISDPQILLKPEHLIGDSSAAAADGDASLARTWPTSIGPGLQSDSSSDRKQEMPVPAQIEVVRKARETALSSPGASRIFGAVPSEWESEKRARRARRQAIRAAQEIKVVNACRFRLVEEDEFKTRTYVCSCPMCRKRNERQSLLRQPSETSRLV